MSPTRSPDKNAKLLTMNNNDNFMVVDIRNMDMANIITKNISIFQIVRKLDVTNKMLLLVHIIFGTEVCLIKR